MNFAVAAGPFKFCCIECARHNGFEPTRMLMADEHDDTCIGCDADLKEVS